METLKKIYEILNYNRIVVYGAGSIASNFLKTLSRKRYLSNVAYVVTKTGEEAEIEGKKVYKLGELDEERDTFYLIAAHEVSKYEIEKELDQLGYHNHIWVAPYIFDILYGLPTFEEKRIKYIWDANKQWYIIAARYLAISDYYGKCEKGFDIYKRLLSLYSNEDTVRKRMTKFISLIEDFNNRGIDTNYPISCLNNNILIDGAHRVALAIYHDIDSVQCKIYNSTMIYDSINANNIFIDHDTALQMGIDENDIRILEETTSNISILLQDK